MKKRLFMIAQPVPSEAKESGCEGLLVCFGFASQPPTAPRNDKVISKLVLVILAACFSLADAASFAQEIKTPNVAGTFYPDNPKELSKLIDSFLDEANPEALGGPIFALIQPHAGYGYSGKVAAFGYKLIKGKPYKTVVIIGPSHYYGFNGVSVYALGKFRTPLGELEVDTGFTQNLLDKDSEVIFEPKAFEKEHSVEAQLPFLQKTLSDFKIVPIVLGDCSLSTCKKLALMLKEAIGSRQDVLVVASSDMYHGYNYQEAQIIDAATLAYLKNMEAEALYYGLREGKLQLCGSFGVVSTLILAKEFGHKTLKVLDYTNSAQVTGKKDKGIWTVGYASFAIDRAPLETASRQKENIVSLTGQEKGEQAMLNNGQKAKLLKIARTSIQAYLKTGKKLEVSESDPLLVKQAGAFVTLHEAGQLRGCIGNLAGSQPLYLTIRDMAVEAAVGDPRFSMLKADELGNIEIEISVLSPLEKIDSVDRIKLGTHGVVVKKGFNSGVFLPQVATETGWSKEEFLSFLCSHKAGLAADAWKDKATEIYIFSAEVFSEKEISGGG